jgi:tetraacyldisaccharide 4'-kinase
MRPVRVTALKNGAEQLAPGTRVAAFCAVGNPSSFFENVRRLEFEIAIQKVFHDHHVYSQAEIDVIVKEAKEAGATALLTTAKDAVKLRTLSFTMPCYVMEIEIEIEKVDEFTELLEKALHDRAVD